jgi:preprotein translocase subunit SecG
MQWYNYVTIGTTVLLTFLILIQTRGASLGAGLGSSGEINTERRGTDKSLHQITIITTIIFAISLMLAVIL